VLDFWFDFGSNYSYLSVMRIEQAAAMGGVQVRWKPFLLGPVFASMGWPTSPFVLQKEKGTYVWQDMARQCRKQGIGWRQPRAFPRSAVLALRVALVGAEQPWMARYCRRMMSLNFAEDRDIDALPVVEAVLHELALPAAEILAHAHSHPIKLELRRQTEAAQALGIFGAPMFFVGPDMYWGNDRLDDALAACSEVLS
jgi:2-hydroxychromene-2-carboxylate isomerase